MWFTDEERLAMKDILATLSTMQTTMQTTCEEIKVITGSMINTLSYNSSDKTKVEDNQIGMKRSEIGEEFQIHKSASEEDSMELLVVSTKEVMPTDNNEDFLLTEATRNIVELTKKETQESLSQSSVHEGMSSNSSAVFLHQSVTRVQCYFSRYIYLFENNALKLFDEMLYDEMLGGQLQNSKLFVVHLDPSPYGSTSFWSFDPGINPIVLCEYKHNVFGESGCLNLQSQPQSPVYWIHNGSELVGMCSVASIARSGFHIVSLYHWSSMVKVCVSRSVSDVAALIHLPTELNDQKSDCANFFIVGRFSVTLGGHFLAVEMQLLSTERDNPDLSMGDSKLKIELASAVDGNCNSPFNSYDDIGNYSSTTTAVIPSTTAVKPPTRNIQQAVQGNDSSSLVRHFQYTGEYLVMYGSAQSLSYILSKEHHIYDKGGTEFSRTPEQLPIHHVPCASGMDFADLALDSPIVGDDIRVLLEWLLIQGHSLIVVKSALNVVASLVEDDYVVQSCVVKMTKGLGIEAECKQNTLTDDVLKRVGPYVWSILASLKEINASFSFPVINITCRNFPSKTYVSVHHEWRPSILLNHFLKIETPVVVGRIRLSQWNLTGKADLHAQSEVMIVIYVDGTFLYLVDLYNSKSVLVISKETVSLVLSKNLELELNVKMLSSTSTLHRQDCIMDGCLAVGTNHVVFVVNVANSVCKRSLGTAWVLNSIALHSFQMIHRFRNSVTRVALNVSLQSSSSLELTVLVETLMNNHSGNLQVTRLDTHLLSAFTIQLVLLVWVSWLYLTGYNCKFREIPLNNVIIMPTSSVVNRFAQLQIKHSAGQFLCVAMGGSNNNPVLINNTWQLLLSQFSECIQHPIKKKSASSRTSLNAKYFGESYKLLIGAFCQSLEITLRSCSHKFSTISLFIWVQTMKLKIFESWQSVFAVRILMGDTHRCKSLSDRDFGSGKEQLYQVSMESHAVIQTSGNGYSGGINVLTVQGNFCRAIKMGLLQGSCEQHDYHFSVCFFHPYGPTVLYKQLRGTLLYVIADLDDYHKGARYSYKISSPSAARLLVDIYGSTILQFRGWYFFCCWFTHIATCPNSLSMFTPSQLHSPCEYFLDLLWQCAYKNTGQSVRYLLLLDMNIVKRKDYLPIKNSYLASADTVISTITGNHIVHDTSLFDVYGCTLVSLLWLLQRFCKSKVSVSLFLPIAFKGVLLAIIEPEQEARKKAAVMAITSDLNNLMRLGAVKRVVADCYHLRQRPAILIHLVPSSWHLHEDERSGLYVCNTLVQVSRLLSPWYTECWVMSRASLYIFFSGSFYFGKRKLFIHIFDPDIVNLGERKYTTLCQYWTVHQLLIFLNWVEKDTIDILIVQLLHYEHGGANTALATTLGLFKCSNTDIFQGQSLVEQVRLISVQHNPLPVFFLCSMFTCKLLVLA